MTTEQSNRRLQARRELGLTRTREDVDTDLAISKEKLRHSKKELKSAEIKTSSSYRAVQSIAKYMDKYFLDPIIGFIFPAAGDFLSSILAVPYIYVSACKVRSLPLTLAVIFNVLRDIVLGLIPMWVGNIIDIFNRSYLQNARLIVGFVEDDRQIIEEVNRKSVWMGICIVIFCVLCYLLVKFAIVVAIWFKDLISSIF